MGLFRSTNGNGGEEQSPSDLEDPPPRRTRPSTLRNVRRSSAGGTPLGRTASGRIVSCTAKTVKVGSASVTTKNSSARSQGVNQIKTTSNGDVSFRSFISDLDLESPEMTPIGEGYYEDDVKRILARGPMHDTEGSSDPYPSADFTLENQTCANNSRFSIANISKGSLSRSIPDDNISSGDFYDAFSVSGASVMMDRSRAENVGRSGTRFVYIVLLITGIIVSVMINMFARNYEYKNFELEFRSLARETADLAETNAEHTFSQLQTMATTVTSEGLVERVGESGVDKSWPNVTIPHFDKRIDDFSESFGAIMLLYVPLIESKDKELWTEYANVHAPWREKYDISDGNYSNGDDVGRRRMDHFHPNSSSYYGNGDGYLHIHTYDHLTVLDEAREKFYYVRDFEEEILTQGGFEDPLGLSAPIYQYGGPLHERTGHSHIALMDLMSHPVFKKEVIASIEYDVPVISEYMDVQFLIEGLSARESGGEADSSSLLNNDYAMYRNQGQGDIDTSNATFAGIRSMTLHPVKENFESDARTIGFVVGVVPWNAFFKNVLKSSKVADDTNDQYTRREANGIVVVVVSDCGSVFTVVLNNRDGTTEVRLGDWKEQYENYQHLNHTSKFFWKEHGKGQSKHCHFDLNIYPNEEFRAEYREGSVAIYSSIVGGIFLFTALLFACYDHFIFKGQQHIVNEAEGMIVQNARRAAKNERELNDFIAHEVRNPLAAAISACSFVSSAITEDAEALNSAENGEAERVALIASDEKRKEVQDDIMIIDSSLHFINDLLRNMLDIQRAGSNQINVEKKPTNIMDDIFKPVQAMLHLRDAPFKVIMEVDCGLHSGNSQEDNQLIVMTDAMRLKQVMLNLVRNATKFVDKGFIRCTANVNPLNGLVELRVDDSGPGIPPEKRNRVFGKFQQSLDTLQQGTGIGLSLCKRMITMMGGALFIDEDYNSGIEGCRGTRFVIQLKIPPLHLNDINFDLEISNHERARLRRQHLLACTESSNVVEYPPTTETIEKQCSSIDSSDRFEEEEVIRLKEPAPILKNDIASSMLADGEVRLKTMEEVADKKQPSRMLPPPMELKLPPAGDTVQDQQPEVPDPQKDQSGKLTELPKGLSVLFVDDDMIVRKLFSRTLKKINPTWKCKEASSGEMAIDLISSNAECTEGFQDEGSEGKREDGDCGFDLIFMDQYMASVQKQLLGTETVRKIRANGFHRPIICGLSANDVEEAFYSAGSDAFMFKPFPCKKDELERELLKVLNSRENGFLTSS